jgi:hypothetical protein
MSPEMSLRIDFLVVGAARSGTTWLYQCLSDHPQICLTKKKEFDPLTVDGKLAPGLAEQFDCNEGALRGAMPVYYSARPETSTLVRRRFPEAKILFCLRNPIERAYSQYRHNIARGALVGATFGEAIRQNSFPLNYGLYADAVESYRRDFGGNVLVLLAEDMRNDQRGSLHRVEQFLGIKKLDSKYLGTFVSAARIGRKSYRSEWLFKFRTRLLRAGATFKHIGGKPANWILKTLKVGALTNMMANLNYSKEIDMGAEKDTEEIVMQSEDREFLQRYYAQDIKRLSLLLNRELNWY